MSTATLKGLTEVSNHDLERLLRAFHKELVSSPITRSALITVAFGDIETHLDVLIGRDLASAKALLLAVLAERRSERGSGARLSLMGPPAPGTCSRDLVEQVRELLASATTSVALVGLTLEDTRDGVLKALRALSGGRDVRTMLVLDAYGVADAGEKAHNFVSERLRGVSNLSVYTCSAVRLRARAVVIDDRRALITSGDLTGSEDDATLDVGALVDDTMYVRALAEEWQRQIDNGVFERVS